MTTCDYSTPPPLTHRQEVRLYEWLTALNKVVESRVRAHDLAWIVETESRPGRGHNLQALHIDADVCAHLSMDPYGNGDEMVGTVSVDHSTGDEECPCEPCTAERAEEDR